MLGLLVKADVNSEEFAAFQRIIKSSLIIKGQWVPPELSRNVTLFTQNFPGSIFLKRAGEILAEAKQRSQTWADGQLTELEALLADKDFKRARELIDNLLSGPVPEERRESLLAIREEVLLAETKEMEFQQQAQEQKQAIEWSEALNLLDSRRYDEAITALGVFVGTAYEEEARAKIGLAANQAANENRRQAANLFVKARKTQDKKYRQELLQESRQLLVDILQKYPQSEIIDKVKQNLRIIEEQIRNVDPGGSRQVPDSQSVMPSE
jgi:hypothetical protein